MEILVLGLLVGSMPMMARTSSLTFSILAAKVSSFPILLILSESTGERVHALMVAALASLALAAVSWRAGLLAFRSL